MSYEKFFQTHDELLLRHGMRSRVQRAKVILNMWASMTASTGSR